MMGHKTCFYGEIWSVTPKLSLLLLLIWSTEDIFLTVKPRTNSTVGYTANSAELDQIAPQGQSSMDLQFLLKQILSQYSRTSVARTLMARLPRL